MEFIKSLIKRKLPITVAVGLIYLTILMYSIIHTNNTFMIYYPIEPYIFGSDFPDFVFPILVSVPFAYYIFYLTKNRFLDYVAMRIKPEDYIKKEVLSCIVLVFAVVFIVNIISIGLSVKIASIDSAFNKPDYSGFILGNMQVNSPILFGVIWSLHKAIIGSMMCLLGLIISLYINNLFLALTGTFLLTLLENFLTATIGLQRFSLTTAYVLNRLQPSVMEYKNILIGMCTLAISIYIIRLLLRKKYEKNI